MFVISFSCFRKYFLKNIKSETWADGRHFGFLEVVYHVNMIYFIDYHEIVDHVQLPCQMKCHYSYSIILNKKRQINNSYNL